MTLYLLYENSLEKLFIILETERAIESDTEKKSCSNWNYGVAKEIIEKVRGKDIFSGNRKQL